MNVTYLFPAFLMLHLTALVVMAGATFIDYLCHLSLWRYVDQPVRPLALLNVMDKLPVAIRVGGAALVFSGIGMMALTHGVFGEQLWFRIKFGIVILLMLNGVVFGRRLGVKLRKLLSSPGPVHITGLTRIRTNLNLFYMIQLSLFILIVFLSSFKFN